MLIFNLIFKTPIDKYMFNQTFCQKKLVLEYIKLCKFSFQAKWLGQDLVRSKLLPVKTEQLALLRFYFSKVGLF